MPPWSRELRLIHCFEVTGEIAAAAVHLCRFEPIQIVVDLGHARGELLSSKLQTRQTLRYSTAFPAGKQRNDLLVFTANRAQHRIGLGNEEHQIAFQLIERHLLTGGKFVLRQFVQAHQLHWLFRFRNFHAQQFIKALLAFSERE